MEIKNKTKDNKTARFNQGAYWLINKLFVQLAREKGDKFYLFVWLVDCC